MKCASVNVNFDMQTLLSVLSAVVCNIQLKSRGLGIIKGEIGLSKFIV